MKGEICVNKLMPRYSYRIVTLICGGLLLGGCVMAEKYDAEKARSLNFQRLLAQEEKRTGELDSEAKRSKRELMEYEARNRELTAQMQAVQEQMAQVQEEAEAMKESALLERKAKGDMKRASAPMRKAPPVEPMPDTMEPSPSALGINPEVPAAPGLTESLLARSSSGSRQSSTVHVVKPGETLYRISRRYGVTVDKIRKWNKLPDDIIEVGQKLIVGQE
ncbi:MAG: LysM peptidoglycan-binding domain-containing protein [Nitrospirae bacterium]|jgi:nucleoid-associated protein YgaU|nr:LysM peptidoglycan-binding domain-containing protein [Nitrospirota bacterium]